MATCMVLCIIMVASMSSLAFAGTDVAAFGTTFQITTLADDIIIIADGNNTGLMQMEYVNEKMRITVTELEGNVAEGYFVYDKVNGTMYSSYTNQTFYLTDIISENGPVNRAAGDVVSRTTYRVSYNTLANAVTPTSGQISIASAIITIIAALQGVTIATTATIFVGLLSTQLWDNIRDGLVNRSTSHGISVVVAKVEIQKHQGGRIVLGYKYEIESVGTY